MQLTLATIIICIAVLPQQIQSCHPPAGPTSSLSAEEAVAQNAQPAADATPGTTAATTTAATCNTCNEAALATLDATDAVRSLIPANEVGTIIRPTFTQDTDANGCTRLTTTCPTGNQAEIRVHLEQSTIGPDWGNAFQYQLTCKSNGNWYVSGGDPSFLHTVNGRQLPAFEPALCGESTLGLTDCIVEGWSCITRINGGK